MSECSRGSDVMIDKKSEKYLQFEKLWNGLTPKGVNEVVKNEKKKKQTPLMKKKN